MKHDDNQMTQESSTSNEGRLHVYTGDGKGKTTSCVGLAVRASGAGLSILFIQFDKGPPDDSNLYSERKILHSIENITLIPTGCARVQSDGSFRMGTTNEDKIEAKRGLDEAVTGIREGKYDLIILDEIVTSTTYGLIQKEDLESIVNLWIECGKKCELVLSGRGASDWLVNQADLVTEMKKIKHYYDKGIPARHGIEY